MEVNVQRDHQPLFTLVQHHHTEWHADKGAFIQQHIQCSLPVARILQNPVLAGIKFGGLASTGVSIKFGRQYSRHTLRVMS